MEPFGDLTLTLAQIDCELGRDSCDSQLKIAPYIYGRPLVIFMSLFPSLAPFERPIAWTILFLVTILFSLFVILVNRFRALLLVMLTLMSPPYQLMVERMNIDILILFGVLIAAALFSKRQYFASSILVATTVLIKFYTLILLVLYFAPSRNKHFKLFIFFVLALSIYAFFGFKQVSGDLSSLGGGNFGLKPLFYWLMKTPKYVNMILGGLISVVIIIYSFTTWRYFSQSKAPIFDTRLYMTCFRFFAFISITIFFVGSNWDYRILFINIPLAILMCCSPRAQGEFSVSIWFLYVAINYLSFNVSGFLQFIGDIAISLSISIFITLIGIGIKNRKTEEN